MTVDVFDLRDVPPGDLPRLDAEGGGQAAALVGAGSVPALDDRIHYPFVQRRRRDQPAKPTPRSVIHSAAVLI